MNAKIIQPTGEFKEVTPQNGTDFKLEELQKIVGGYIQVVNLHNGKIFVINEEGKLKSLLSNAEATKIARASQAIFDDDYIAGTAVLMPSEMLK